MYHQTYYVLGYGIHINELPGIKISNLANLIHSAPQYEKLLFYEMLDEALSNYTTMKPHGMLTIAVVLKSVIKECEGLDLIIAVNEDENGNEDIFLLYPPKFPWETIDNKINQEYLNTVFERFSELLTGKKITPQFYDWGSST